MNRRLFLSSLAGFVSAGAGEALAKNKGIIEDILDNTGCGDLLGDICGGGGDIFDGGDGEPASGATTLSGTITFYGNLSHRFKRDPIEGKTIRHKRGGTELASTETDSDGMWAIKITGKPGLYKVEGKKGFMGKRRAFVRVKRGSFPQKKVVNFTAIRIF